ncbi:MAG TPA: hypothetical protein VF613_24095 [Longimicrobium sp.]|jgi:hypothetical protein
MATGSASEPTLYVVTYYAFNHAARQVPIDARFLKSDRNIVYFLIDKSCPEPLRDKKVLFESRVDPLLAEAGKRYFAEWTFLLAEAKHAFCTYPLFTVSSRFYEKNRWLQTDLNQEWDRLFGHLEQYGWGYLPSYDRPFGWQDLTMYQTRGLLPVTPPGRTLIQDMFGVGIPDTYHLMSDFFCNYIGFQSREHLLEYVNFYKPLIDTLFDENYVPREDLSRYVESTGTYRNEKPFTFLLELMSHLFFHNEDRKFLGLHYDGYYEVDERRQRMKLIEAIPFDFSKAQGSPRPGLPRRVLSRAKRELMWKYGQLRTRIADVPAAPSVRPHLNP